MTGNGKNWLLSLEDIPDASRELVGGKARHLGMLLAEGFPVPSGVVVVTDAYREFMAQPEIRERARGLCGAAEGGASDEALAEVYDAFRGAVLAAPLPEPLPEHLRQAFDTLAAGGGALAVRSSGVLEDAHGASFSGMLTSVIGVENVTDLAVAVKRCWVSASRPRLLHYMQRTGMCADDLDVAVILQRLVPAERAGLVFTRDPVNPYALGVIVESTYGPGEDVVSGAVTPQRYAYYPADGRVVFVRESRARRAAQPPELRRHLTDSEVAELARWGLRAEELFGAPQDVEWAYGDGRFWILQSRPLVLSERDEEDFFPQVAEETVLLHGVGASPQVGAGVVFVAAEDAGATPPCTVVVLRRLTNDLAVRLRDAAAVVADEGGATSHGANILREFGVPTVISTGHATSRLRDGMTVTVDGFRGHVYEGDLSVRAHPLGSIPATRMKVFASVLVPEKSDFVVPYADGVSSLRNDYFLLKSGIHPREMIARGRAAELEETIYRGICRTAETYAGKPIWYKTMDAPTDEFRRLAGGEQEPHERNPLLGWRGIGREIAEPEMFAVEVRAVARAAAEGYGGLGIKLPFIRFVREFDTALRMVREFGLGPDSAVEVGISVETPAVALCLQEFLDEGAAFVSVGVSDLTMCTLALDRESHNVAAQFDPAHPAVLELLERIVVTAHGSGVFACATGESARAEGLLPHLLRMGFDAIGVSPAYFAEVKRRIAAIEAGE